jgi:phosphoglycerate dehydrogenase-like enzyme
MADVVWGRNEPIPAALFEEALAETEVIITGDWRRYPAGFLDRAPKLKAILSISGGFSPGLDYGRCFERSIRVLSASAAFGRSVAEMALGLAIAAGREIVFRDRDMRQGTEVWGRESDLDRAFSLFGKTVGLIGFGGIARSLKELLAPFGCRILVHDPWLPDAVIERAGCRPTTLVELMQASKVVFVLAAPTTENRAMLNREKLRLMQRNSVLILISRAHVVDFEALTELVEEGVIKAGIDVYPQEPLPKDHPIRKAGNAILTPHRAGTVRECYWRIGKDAVDDLELILRGLPPSVMVPAVPELIEKYLVQ